MTDSVCPAQESVWQMNERGSVQPFGSDNRGKGLKENEQSVTVADNEMEDVDFEDECQSLPEIDEEMAKQLQEFAGDCEQSKRTSKQEFRSRAEEISEALRTISPPEVNRILDIIHSHMCVGDQEATWICMIYHNLVKKENGHSKSGRDDMVLEDTNWMKELNVFSTVVDDSCRKQQPNKEKQQAVSIPREKRKLLQEDQPRESIEREIAYIFTTKGYSLSYAKEVYQQMDGNKYNSVLTSIARQGLRKLSEIMRKNLNQTVKIFDGAEERMLRSSLVNCRKWMEGGQVRTYFKILQIVFEIAQQPIFPSEVISLYDAIMSQLEKLSGKKQPRPIYTPLPAGGSVPMGGNKVESIETIRYEREIIDLYIRHKSIDLVREFLSRKYSDRVWDSVNLRQIIIKAFRTSLQKIEKRRRQYANLRKKVPPLQVNEAMIQDILQNPNGLNARNAILGYYLSKTTNAQLLLSTIQIINDFTKWNSEQSPASLAGSNWKAESTNGLGQGKDEVNEGEYAVPMRLISKRRLCYNEDSSQENNGARQSHSQMQGSN